jgi:hypothetical protein
LIFLTFGLIVAIYAMRYPCFYPATQSNRFKAPCPTPIWRVVAFSWPSFWPT